MISIQQIKLWEIELEVFEEPSLTGLLPLLPLTKNGQNRETVERMLRDMELAGASKEVYSMGEMVATLVLTSEQDKEWLKARFRPMLNIFEESWLYQEILQKGKQQGQEQTQGQDILLFVELHFPLLLAQAKQVIERGMSLQQLQALLRDLYRANTIGEAKEALEQS
jgi:hypothetical protein